MKTKKTLCVCAFLVFLSGFLFAAEYVDGRIRLVINENTGRFSLYFMTDIAREQYEPFFSSEDPRTSFLVLMANDRVYRMGESSAFRTRLAGTPSNPALTFESSFLTVTEEFTFIRTADSSLTNGVRITVSIANRGEQQVQAGLRFLIDTSLGEASANHFSTEQRQISSETRIDSHATDTHWISKNDTLALMGGIQGNNITRPDEVIFGNWKRLNDTPWKYNYVAGRNFNLLPYSIGDSAVCYYFEPAAIQKGGIRLVSMVLASEDENGFLGGDNTPVDISRLIRESAESEPDLDNMIRTDLVSLRDLLKRIDEYIASGEIPDDELAAIVLVLNKFKAKYGIK
ncbi:MAG: hypothetical protein LBB82_04425 [Treponema sp.]|jgi:hypothetical protein|nr:hypothetical protein [Treponema sp.]